MSVYRDLGVSADTAPSGGSLAHIRVRGLVGNTRLRPGRAPRRVWLMLVSLTLPPRPTLPG